jgi:hypothetical protein
MSDVRKARLGRYSLWHLRDYLLDKGLGTALVMSLAVLIDWMAYRSMREPPRPSTSPEQRERLMQQAAEMSEQFLTMRFGTLIATLTLVGTLFATNGIVSDDRKNGFYRFLFAKPASVVGFYATKFAMHGVGFLVVALAFLLAYAVAFRPFMPDMLLPGLALLFVAIGGVGFLLSAAWRWDWLSLIAVYIAAEIAWNQLGKREGWRWLAHLFPPVHKVGGVYGAIATEQALPLGDLAWLTGYGLVCFVLGLLVLHHRALATD